MRIGVVSDPHGCLIGLKAALNGLRKEGTDLTICAGDVANFGPQPNECIALLAERGVACVQGNCDRYILLPPRPDPHADERTAQLNAVNDWCRERLNSTSRNWLAALPPRLHPVPGVLVVHGGLKGQEEIVDADACPSFPEGVAVVAAGHLHVPFITRVRRGVWVNAGSAGRSCDGDPRAAIAVLEQHPDGWQASIHRIPFDLEEAVQAIRSAGMPYAERLIDTQRKACWW